MDIPLTESPSSKSKIASSVETQINITKLLLSLRIRMQPLLAACHLLPPRFLYLKLKEENSIISDVQKEASNLLLNLYKQLQYVDVNTTPLQNNKEDVLNELKSSETLQNTNKKRKLNELSKNEEFLWNQIDAKIDKMKRRCLENADMWKKQTQYKKNEAFKSFDQPPSIQVSRSLQDMKRWLNQSIPKLNANQIIGYKQLTYGMSDEVSSILLNYIQQNCYTDEDFYLLLLKDAIASHKGSVSSSTLKSVNHAIYGSGRKKPTIPMNERHLSKAKRLQYTPIVKLENFMSAKVSTVSSDISRVHMDEEVVNCLMQSLFAAD